MLRNLPTVKQIQDTIAPAFNYVVAAATPAVKYVVDTAYAAAQATKVLFAAEPAVETTVAPAAIAAAPAAPTATATATATATTDVAPIVAAPVAAPAAPAAKKVLSKAELAAAEKETKEKFSKVFAQIHKNQEEKEIKAVKATFAKSLNEIQKAVQLRASRIKDKEAKANLENRAFEAKQAKQRVVTKSQQIEHKGKMKNVLVDLKKAVNQREERLKAREIVKNKFAPVLNELKEVVAAKNAPKLSFYQRNKGLINGFAILALVGFAASFLIPGAPLVAAAFTAVSAIFGASLSTAAATTLAVTGLALFAATASAVSAGLGALVGLVYEKATSKKAIAPVAKTTKSSTKDVLATVNKDKDAAKPEVAAEAKADKTAEVKADKTAEATKPAAPVAAKPATLFAKADKSNKAPAIEMPEAKASTRTSALTA